MTWSSWILAVAARGPSACGWGWDWHARHGPAFVGPFKVGIPPWPGATRSDGTRTRSDRSGALPGRDVERLGLLAVPTGRSVRPACDAAWPRIELTSARAKHRGSAVLALALALALVDR